MNLRQLLVTVDALERRNAELEPLHALAASLEREVGELLGRNRQLADDTLALQARLDAQVPAPHPRPSPAARRRPHSQRRRPHSQRRRPHSQRRLTPRGAGRRPGARLEWFMACTASRARV